MVSIPDCFHSSCGRTRKNGSIWAFARSWVTSLGYQHSILQAWFMCFFSVMSGWCRSIPSSSLFDSFIQLWYLHTIHLKVIMYPPMRIYDLHVEIGVPFKHSANFHGDQQHILFRHTIFIGENPPTNSCPIEMTSKLSLVGVMFKSTKSHLERDFRIISPKKAIQKPVLKKSRECCAKHG